MIAGVDGYKHGWIAAVDLGNGKTAVRTYASFNALVEDTELTQIAIDIPIGLLERGARACDREARRVLGRRQASSVFPAPIRAMLTARSWKAACRILFQAERKQCSKQLWNILPKIREVDARMNRELQDRIREVHPEVSFALMNGGKTMTSRKTTPAGRAERLRLLKRHFKDLRSHLGDVGGARTDIIDAYACLWTARRIFNSEAVAFANESERDAKELRAEIVA